MSVLPSPQPGPARDSPRGTVHSAAGSWDLGLGVALALAAATAVILLPGGHPARLAVAVLVLFVVPGYLLIQAIAPPTAPVRVRGLHLVLSLGVSPAIVGLLALGTALIPGGFRAEWIVAFVSLACLLFALAAYRRRNPRPAPEPEGLPVEESSRSTPSRATPRDT